MQSKKYYECREQCLCSSKKRWLNSNFCASFSSQQGVSAHNSTLMSSKRDPSECTDDRGGSKMLPKDTMYHGLNQLEVINRIPTDRTPKQTSYRPFQRGRKSWNRHLMPNSNRCKAGRMHSDPNFGRLLFHPPSGLDQSTKDIYSSWSVSVSIESN